MRSGMQQGTKTGTTGHGTVLVGAVLLCALGSPAMAKEYTLPQLIAKVRAEYPGVLAARQNVAVARAQQAQAERAWAPTGTLDATIFGAGSNRCTGLNSEDK